MDDQLENLKDGLFATPWPSTGTNNGLSTGQWHQRHSNLTMRGQSFTNLLLVEPVQCISNQFAMPLPPPLLLPPPLQEDLEYGNEEATNNKPDDKNASELDRLQRQIAKLKHANKGFHCDAIHCQSLGRSAHSATVHANKFVLATNMPNANLLKIQVTP